MLTKLLFFRNVWGQTIFRFLFCNSSPWAWFFYERFILFTIKVLWEIYWSLPNKIRFWLLFCYFWQSLLSLFLISVIIIQIIKLFLIQFLNILIREDTFSSWIYWTSITLCLTFIFSIILLSNYPVLDIKSCSFLVYSNHSHCFIVINFITFFVATID